VDIGGKLSVGEILTDSKIALNRVAHLWSDFGEGASKAFVNRGIASLDPSAGGASKKKTKRPQPGPAVPHVHGSFKTA
jgi:hypothetical protein